jgi:CheY-like chemotaxis protein
MKGKPVILVVDDQPQNIELLEAYLVPNGYEIIMATSGEDALGKLSGNQIDLILLDVMMPGMDGFEVARRVRQDNTHRLLPIIMVSSLRETEDRVKGIEAGCDDFLSKPIDKITLLARVRSLLKVKAYNDLMRNYRQELESEVIRRTGELNNAMENLKRAELDRIARAVAEEANRAKSLFVASMSHEIRTPMNAILGFAQILERDPSLSPEQVEHVRIITRSGAHLLRLIGDVLDISKIESGQITLNEAAFCLHDLLNDMELMFRSRVNAQGLQLLIDRDESLPRYVIADDGKLRQILVNLIGNAVKFTVTGGVTVRVCADAVEGKTGKDPEALRLMVEVEDTGPGIPDADICCIFDLFQQGEAGVKAGGAGLGLTICRKFVEMMGGELTVTSQVGKGSCFRFEVLLKPAAEIAEGGKPASRRIVGLEPGTGPFRILVADDAPTNRALLCALLRPVGFEVAEAVNGVEALDVFVQWSPHAVFMDMHMPVMDGYEATRRIKSTEAGRSTPVIALTAIILEGSQTQIMAAGVDTYLRKPFQAEELFEVVGKCLDLHYVFADEPDKTLSHPKPASQMQAVPIALPNELIQAMRQAVEEGDIDRLTKLIVQVEKLDGAKSCVLQALADEFDYEKLGQWLEKEVTDNA